MAKNLHHWLTSSKFFHGTVGSQSLSMAVHWSLTWSLWELTPLGKIKRALLYSQSFGCCCFTYRFQNGQSCCRHCPTPPGIDWTGHETPGQEATTPLRSTIIISRNGGILTNQKENVNFAYRTLFLHNVIQSYICYQVGPWNDRSRWSYSSSVWFKAGRIGQETLLS